MIIYNYQWYITKRKYLTVYRSNDRIWKVRSEMNGYGLQTKYKKHRFINTSNRTMFRGRTEIK